MIDFAGLVIDFSDVLRHVAACACGRYTQSTSIVPACSLFGVKGFWP